MSRFFRRDRSRDLCREDYEFVDEDSPLGSGSFATVYKARSRADGSVWAVKMIEKTKLESKEDVEALETEVEILERLDHPNVVRLRQVYDTSRCFYMVMEMLTGGELFDRIVEKERYTEEEASATMRKVVDALAYAHGKGIVHRDLKPENLLYASEAEDAEIKIADFGLGKLLPDEDMTMVTACGTPGYVAPEILRAEAYTSKVDMWSVGIITYILLSGYPPFYHENTAVLFELIKSGRFEFHEEYWADVSEEAKDFIAKLLVVEPADRPSAKDALSHPWLAVGSGVGEGKALSGAQKELRKYLVRRKFRAKVLAAQAINRMKAFSSTGGAAAAGGGGGGGGGSSLVEKLKAAAEADKKAESKKAGGGGGGDGGTA